MNGAASPRRTMVRAAAAGANARADTRGEVGRIIALAWPVALTSLNWTILQITDTIVVGLTGSDQVAALGASRAVTFVTIVTGIAWLSGVLVAASRAAAAPPVPGGAPREAGVARAGVLLALVIGAVVGLPFYAGAGVMLRVLGVAPALIGPAAQVGRIMAMAFPLQLIMIVLGFFLEGISQPRRAMIVNLAMLPANALLAWGLATGHLGLPAMGARGAAAATLIATAGGAAAMVAAVSTLPGALGADLRAARGREWTAAVAPAVRMATFGAVPAIAAGLELAGFSVLIALSTRLGTAVAHGFQIVVSVHNIVFGIAIGLASAAGVRVGNAVGEGVAARAVRRAAIAAMVATGVSASLALVIALARRPIVGVFPAGPRIHAVAALMLLDWAPFIPFDAVQLVFVYALRSLGDQVAAGANSVIAYFVVTGGVGLWLIHAGAGPFGLVAATGAGMVAAALLNGTRLVVVRRRCGAAGPPPR